MVEEYCGWTREIDWGNAPSWVAVTVATVVGLFTCANVLLARRSYVEGKWEKRVSQARLVYSTYSDRKGYADGEPWHYSGKPTIVGMELLEPTDRGGYETLAAKGDVYECQVSVYNNSAEPILDGTLMLADTRSDLSEGETELGTLHPHEERHFIFLARDYPDDPFSVESVLHFRDSAGNRWQRYSTKPPEDWEAIEASRTWKRFQIRKQRVS